jgi:hypothetical protein
MKKLRASRLLGRFFAASAAKLQEIAERLELRYVVNLAGAKTRITVPDRSHLGGTKRLNRRPGLDTFCEPNFSAS